MTTRYAIWGIVGLVLLIGLLTLAGWAYDPFGWKKNRLEKARAEAAQTKGQLATSNAQVDVQQEATRVLEKQVERSETIRTIHEENVRVIQSAPGASDPLPPELAAAVNDGLCRYAATPRTGCGEVRGGDTGKLQDAR